MSKLWLPGSKLSPKPTRASVEKNNQFLDASIKRLEMVCYLQQKQIKKLEELVRYMSGLLDKEKIMTAEIADTIASIMRDAKEEAGKAEKARKDVENGSNNGAI